MVAINGNVLEFKAYDLEGRLFDYTKIEKQRKKKTCVARDSAER